MADQEPVFGGEEEEELDTTKLDEDQIAPEEVPEGEPQGEEEEMPDDLLTPAELEERNRQRGETRAPESKPEAVDRSALVSELGEIFRGISRQQQPPPAREEQPARQELAPFTLSDEKAQELTEKILSQPGGVAKAIAWAVNVGEQRAMQRMAGSNEGQAALQSAGESFADRYVARKLRDPDTKFGKAVEPIFADMIRDYNMIELARMNQADRNDWLESMWERATGRTLMQKATTKRPPSPGVARGAGSRPGSPNTSRVVVRMSDQDKRDLRAASPHLFSGPEGEKRFLRQVWEIEHGKTSDPTVRRSVGESMRFSEAVGFGG